MIVGIGIDLVELDHMASVLKKQPRIFEKILTEKEIEIYESRGEKRRLEFLAGRYAVKEAFSKAMGTGIGKTVTFQNISVLNNEKGQPIVVASPYEGNVFVSISHSKQMVVAQVVLEKAE
jgi:holo-[acyl-carrier protein] synthase